MIQVSALYRYPIKSCAGFAVPSAEVGVTGFVGDRQWMIIDEQGQFLTQREEPRLALIRPMFHEEHSELEAPATSPITFVPRYEGTSSLVRVWGDLCLAIPQEPAVDGWLSDFLGRKARLVVLSRETMRQIDRRYAQEGEYTAFNDGFPFLLISQPSLDLLNSKLAQPVGMDRFRPNIVVTGCDPHAEDGWSSFRIAGVPLAGVKLCARCAVITTDQQSAERTPEPLRTLATYRTIGGKVMFGQNVIHRGRGTLSVGDVVELLEA